MFYRKYETYSEYIEHQKSKLNTIIEQRKDEKIFSDIKNKFKERCFRPILDSIKGPKVLSLASRLGEEVYALRELGFPEAIGLDLNPGPNNKVVIEGDFHSTPFPDFSFDTIYFNSLDHAYSHIKLFKEIHRIIKPSGILLLQVPFLRKDDSFLRMLVNMDKCVKWESLTWKDVDEVRSWFSPYFLETDYFKHYTDILKLTPKRIPKDENSFS